MKIIFKEDSCEGPSFLLHAGKDTSQMMKVKNANRDRQRQREKERERGDRLTDKQTKKAIIQRNLPPVCLAAYLQVINRLKAWL